MKTVKFVFVFVSLYFTSTVFCFSSQCPDLAGKYYCSFRDNVNLFLVISQQAAAESRNDRTAYMFNYVDIPGDPESILASVQGEVDKYGWTTYCSDKCLRSVSSDGSLKSEWCLDISHGLTQMLNDQFSASCYFYN